MTFHRYLVAPTALVLAVGVLLAGCSGSSGSRPPAAVTEAGSSGGGSNAAGGSSATCKQLTKAEVQPLMVETITGVTVTAAGVNGEGQQCVFSGQDGAGGIDVLVLRGADASLAYNEAVKAETDGPVDVPGVGDRASRDTGDDQINSIKGNLYCSVSLGSAADVPGIGRLEQAAGGTTHIAESANATAAAALGTLCNRIYGSGNTTPDLRMLTGSAAATP